MFERLLQAATLTLLLSLLASVHSRSSAEIRTQVTPRRSNQLDQVVSLYSFKSRPKAFKVFEP